ncbi:hypothetical protein [Planctomicrobium piriforme]|uniref:HAMP domain-containing protein n=1 Tax=Planctomicrobium piriforme TaxID=1576369 RepID=A0A1I3GX36_9PLAN|nr:hypothetical protein [Planctomicrobium piriforme]SFI27941.1 hypothetical protein SAMN05421753_107160 [Planctomicrobium piriforme]
MSQPHFARKRIFVSGQIQGSVLLRFGMYWFVYHFVLWHTLFLFYFAQYRAEVLNGGPVESFAQIYSNFCSQYYPMLLAALAVLPLLIYDSIRTTHRIAGPLVRFQNTLRRLKAGDRIESVQLRDGDLLLEFQREFNDFLKFYNSQRDTIVAPGATAAEELALLAQVEELRELVATQSPTVDQPTQPAAHVSNA